MLFGRALCIRAVLEIIFGGIEDSRGTLESNRSLYSPIYGTPLLRTSKADTLRAKLGEYMKSFLFRKLFGISRLRVCLDFSTPCDAETGPTFVAGFRNIITEVSESSVHGTCKKEIF